MHKLHAGFRTTLVCVLNQLPVGPSGVDSLWCGLFTHCTAFSTSFLSHSHQSLCNKIKWSHNLEMIFKCVFLTQNSIHSCIPQLSIENSSVILLIGILGIGDTAVRKTHRTCDLVTLMFREGRQVNHITIQLPGCQL